MLAKTITYCVLTKGGSRNSTKCTVGAKVQKRAKTHPGTMECQKYCAGCINIKPQFIFSLLKQTKYIFLKQF
jgi:hypothetical protein